MKYYSYFPGCSSEATAVGLGISAQAIAKPLDMELTELEGWTCCGSTPYGSLNELESIAVAARNLALAEKTGLNLVTPCSSCYVTLNTADRHLKEHPQLMRRVNEALATVNLEYHGNLRVRHLVDVLLNDITPEVIAAKTLQEMEPLINEKVSYSGFPEPLESYKGYNFIKFKDCIYAIAQSLGDLDLMCVEELQLKEYQKQGECIIGDGIDDIKKLIDQLRWKELYELVEENYKGFNIVLYNGRYFAISLRLGGIDISQETEKNLREYQENNDCTVGASLHEVKLLIEQLLYKSLKKDLGQAVKKIYDLQKILTQYNLEDIKT